MDLTLTVPHGCDTRRQSLTTEGSEGFGDSDILSRNSSGPGICVTIIVFPHRPTKPIECFAPHAAYSQNRRFRFFFYVH